MSYAVARSGVGEFSEWAYASIFHTLDTNEVYVLRLEVAGVRLRDGADLLVFARAGGQDQNWGLDVRAVGAWKSDAMSAADDVWMIDIVMTSSLDGKVVPLMNDSGEEMGKQIAADPEVTSVFPHVVVRSSKLGELVGPAAAIDTWRSQPLLWDHALSGKRPLRGGPTVTFAAPADLSLFKGKADDGRLAVPWKMTMSANGPQTHDSGLGAGTIAVVGVAALAVGIVLWRNRRGSGR